MKLLFSSIIFSLAAASMQEGRELAAPTSAAVLNARWSMSEPKINYDKAGRGLTGATSATDLLDRWDMSVPDIVYNADDDKFTFTLTDASPANYNQGLAESFWNPDCMPTQSNDVGRPLNKDLIHRADGIDGLPFFTMQDVSGQAGKRPKMEFKIDPTAFAKSSIPDVYSGTEVSCDTPGVPYSLLLKGMECPVSDRLFTDALSEADCYEKCKANVGCTQFSFSGSNNCFGCSGTAATLVPSNTADLNTYETCDIRDEFEIVDVDASETPSLDFCTATSTAVNYRTTIGSCGNDETGLFASPDVKSVEECHDLCSAEPHCGRFSYWHDYNMCLGCSASADMTFESIPFTPAMQVDFADGATIVDAIVEDRTAPIEQDISGNDNFTALRTGTCGQQAYLPINISPSVRSDVTLVVGVKMESMSSQSQVGWVVGQENGGWDRGILLYDRSGGVWNKYKGIGMPNGVPVRPVWDNDVDGQPKAHEWTHIAAVYSQNGVGVTGKGRLYVNGVQAPIEIDTTNSDGSDRLAIGTLGSVESCVWRADAWIKEVKVYDGALSSKSVQALSTTFSESITPSQTPSTPNYETYAMCPSLPTPNTGANSRIDFCIRSSLGYTINSGAATLSNPAHSGTSDQSNYQEVNFIETLVRIEYDMSSGFEVAAFSVAPKNRELTTISESYEDALTAYLCSDDTSTGNMDPYTFDADESYPKDLTPGSGDDPFNQGALITVCVRVKEEFASQNIVLKELTEFSWSRLGGSTFNRAIGGGDDTTTITQVAITGSEAAGNYLTSYDKTGCENKYWCQFASVLFAQFYNTPGTVTGTGDAILQFQTRRNRRLGEGVDDQRLLQGDPGSAGMDISIDVKGVAEGPGDFKTASGPSFGATTISVSIVIALIGAVLLA